MGRLETSAKPERGRLGKSAKRERWMMGRRKVDFSAPPIFLRVPARVLFKNFLRCNKRATGDEAGADVGHLV